MIKKIKVKQLQPGMFIHDLNCGWLQHPFLANSMKIKNDKIIDKIIDYGIREVYIDSKKGLDVADAPTEKEATQKIQHEINKAVESENKNRDTVSIQEELVRAREIKKDAAQTVRNLMKDVRFGKQIQMEKVNPVVERMVDSIMRNKNALTCLGRIKKQDEYTFMHSVSVCALMISFGKHLGFDQELLKSVGTGGLLHDIGKTRVAIEIITKTGGLTDDEFAKVKEHAVHSRTILEHTSGVNETAIEVAAHHHERLDGKGYPDNLKEKDIGQFAQMAAIIDVYDAMTSRRCYQRQFQPTETLRKLYEWNNLYNRDMVEQFIRCAGIYPVGTLVRLESGLLGVVLEHSGKSLLHPVVRIVFDTKYVRHVMPYDIDLAKSDKDKVANYELPDKWNIRPVMYL